MTMYKICSHCGKRIEFYKQCECMEQYTKERYRLYNKNRTDKKEQRFYSSGSWVRCRDNIKRHYLGMCIVCWYKNKDKNNDINSSELIHHIVELKDDYEQRLDEDNLVSLCDSCHRKVHVLYDKNNKSKIETQKALRLIKKEFDSKYY